MKSEIDLVKKHIKNLLNGYNINGNELRQVFREVTKEHIADLFNTYFKKYDIENFIHCVIRDQAVKQLNTLIKELRNDSHTRYHYGYAPSYIEDMIRKEISDQVALIVKRSFDIKVNGTPLLENVK